jgi:hypothetical protein
MNGPNDDPMVPHVIIKHFGEPDICAAEMLGIILQSQSFKDHQDRWKVLEDLREAVVFTGVVKENTLVPYHLRMKLDGR